MTMKKIILFSSVLILSTPSAQAELDFKVCQKSYSVSGTVHTRIISPALQVGETDLIFKDAAGTEIFKGKGGIIGKINFFDQTTGVASLNHYLVFEDGSSLATHADKGQVLGQCPDQRLKINLSITEFSSATQIFENAYMPSDGGLTAEGCINMQPGGENDFTLSGTICLAQ